MAIILLVVIFEFEVEGPRLVVTSLRDGFAMPGNRINFFCGIASPFSKAIRLQ